jgi:hypothetical protein
MAHPILRVQLGIEKGSLRKAGEGLAVKLKKPPVYGFVSVFGIDREGVKAAFLPCQGKGKGGGNVIQVRVCQNRLGYLTRRANFGKKLNHALPAFRLTVQFLNYIRLTRPFFGKKPGTGYKPVTGSKPIVGYKSVTGYKPAGFRRPLINGAHLNFPNLSLLSGREGRLNGKVPINQQHGTEKGNQAPEKHRNKPQLRRKYNPFLSFFTPRRAG